MENLTKNLTDEAFRWDHEWDQRCVSRYQEGDLSAFEDIAAAHEEHLRRLVHRLLGWSADVDDVVQDVFLAVLTNLHRFRREANFSTWLTRIAVNQCRAYHRRRLLRFRKRRDLVRQETTNGNPRSADDFDFVRDAIQTLPQKYREPVILRYFEHLSLSEIADVLGISVGAVEVRLTRARQRLKTKLAKECKARNL